MEVQNEMAIKISQHWVDSSSLLFSIDMPRYLAMDTSRLVVFHHLCDALEMAFEAAMYD